MAKLIRCRSGHVFDSEAHAACPECARTEALEAENGGAPQGGDDGGGGGGGKRAVASTWLAAGGAAAIVVIAAGFFLARPTPPVLEQKSAAPEHTPPASATLPAVAAADPASDPDFRACAKGAPNDQTNCDRAIASGKFSGVPLARLYLIRGYRRNAQHNAEAAFSDFGEAIKLEPDNPHALAGLGTVYAGRGDCTPALEKLDRSIHLDPNILVAYVGRGACLWKKGDLSGARADYQKALSMNPDPATRTSVESVLALMEAEAPGAKASAPPAQDSSAAASAPAGPKPADTP